MNEETLIQRTKAFAKSVIILCRSLPNNREGRLIGDQLFRSGTSVASNYRAACRGRSKAEFISKLAIVVEESDESKFWLELLNELDITNDQKVFALIKEANELTAIIVASIKTTKRNMKS